MQLDITTNSFHKRCPRKAAIIVLGQDLLSLQIKKIYPEKTQYCNFISKLQGKRRRVNTLEAVETNPQKETHNGNNGHSSVTKTQKRR